MRRVMEGFMYAIFSNHGRGLLGYFNYGMAKEGPTIDEVKKLAVTQFNELGVLPKRMAEMTAKDHELVTNADLLTMDRASEIDQMIDECDTYDAALRLDEIRLRLEELAKRRR